MPKKFKKPCAFPGCPELTDKKYCDKHIDADRRDRLEAQRYYNKYNRTPDVSKKYGSRWRKIRELYISAHPLCEECLLHGLTVPAKEVHHILPVEWGGSHSFDNLMSLCRSCHTKKDYEIGKR